MDVYFVSVERPKQGFFYHLKSHKAMKKTKTQSPKRPESRVLKIQPFYRNSFKNRIVPEIRLCGVWLKQLGFEEESRVVIHASKELIVIRPQEDEL